MYFLFLNIDISNRNGAPSQGLALIVQTLIRMTIFKIFKREPDPFLAKAKWIIVSFSIAPVIFMAIYSFFLPSDYEIFVKEQYRGIVVDKFVDSKNHSCETILIKKDGETELTKFVTFDDSIFFGLIQVNDTLIKKSDCNFLTVCRADTLFNYEVRFRNK